MLMALTPYGGWHGEKDPAESWTRGLMTTHANLTHTGDDVGCGVSLTYLTSKLTSSTNGSNTRGEPGQARRIALSHLRAYYF